MLFKLQRDSTERRKENKQINHIKKKGLYFNPSMRNVVKWSNIL